MKVIACLAASLDGKLSPEGVPGYTRISSRADIDHLLALRAQADAVLFGGETFRAWPKVHRSSNPAHIPHHIIMTRSADFSPQAPLFSAESDITVASPEPVAEAIRARYPSDINWLSFNDIPDLLAQLADRYDIETLLVEGGGQIIRLFLAERSLEEIHLTLCPLVLGGSADWSGGLTTSMESSVRFELLSVHPLGDEVFLHLRCRY